MKLIYENVKLKKVEYIALTLTGILNGGDSVVLVGEIGAGKTTLVSKLAKVMETKQAATSPTFAIVANYIPSRAHRGIKIITHLDTYRLNHVNELYDLGLETIFDSDVLTLIEWGERIEEFIDTSHFRITIDDSSSKMRSYQIETVGEFSNERLLEIEGNLVRDGWRRV